MGVWDGLTGQEDAVAVVRRAADTARGGTTLSDREAVERHAQLGIAAGAAGSAEATSDGMTHAWLITGPPGSGRSNLAYAFASALLGAEDDPRVQPQVDARTHPDLLVLTTEKVVISIDDARDLVASASFSPSISRFRVVVIEDADRMMERTSNVLLKALEEPPPTTIWILCAPSEADLLPTIRSRVRTVRLRIPDVDEVAALLVGRDGIDPEVAARAARHAQSHIGMARRLATDPDSAARREESLRLALSVRGVSSGMRAAARLHALAMSDHDAYTAQRDAEEREDALRSLGIEPGKAVPPALRSALRQLEEDQKRRATRSKRDGIHRVLTDLLSLYRDILLEQLGAPRDRVNPELGAEIADAAGRCRPEETLATIDALALAARRLDANVQPLIALEAMAMSLIRAA